MVERGGTGRPGSELWFADEELSGMNAVVVGNRRRPLSVVEGEANAAAPAAPAPRLRPTLRQRAFNPIDVLVDAAFARDGGPTPFWRHVRDDDGIEPVTPPSLPAVAPRTNLPRRSTQPMSALGEPRPTTGPVVAGRAPGAPPSTAAVRPPVTSAPASPGASTSPPDDAARAAAAPATPPPVKRPSGPQSAVAPGAAPTPPPPPMNTPVTGDARMRVTPTPPLTTAAVTVPAVAPASSGGTATPAASAPLGPAAAPAREPSPAAQRTTTPSLTPVAARPAPPRTSPPRPVVVLASLDDAVYSSSPPPGEEALGFTVPEPPSFRIVVAQSTPRLDATAAVTEAAAAVERHRDDAEELEAAELEEVPEEHAVSLVPDEPEDLAAPPAPPVVPARPVGGSAVAPAPVPSSEPSAPAAAEGDSRTRAVRRRRRAKPWFEELFDDNWLATLPRILPAQTEREIGFVADALHLEPRSTILDVGCGVGRHSIGLASRGHAVTGLDLSLPFIMRAADTARRAGVEVNFVHGDMREMDYEEQFDAACCLFTTFGYFDDETNRQVAALVNKALRPGGRFLVDVINRDYLLGEVPARLWWQAEGCMVLEELDFNYFTSRVQNHRSVVFEDARQLEYDISVRAYSLHEIGKLLHAAGFRVTEVSGSAHTRGRFFGGESRQILIVAEKK